MASIKYPDIDDLRRLVRFSSEDGLIWLAENRMLLLHTAAMAELRRELIESLGQDQARRVLTRMGYASGVRDAELARKIRGDKSVIDAFVVGPQLHMLEGSVQVTPISLEMDVDKGEFQGNFLWEHSWEAEAHLGMFGPAQDPVCWMQIGYASGYTSAFMGRFILFKEVECMAAGHNHCRIEGRPIEQWPDAHEHLPYYQSDAVVSRILELREQVDALRTSLERQRLIPNLIGSSAGFRHAYNLMERAAGTCVSVLLLGETGVGKERFARALHEMSKRANAPFVAVNCAALPHDLIESELFGVEKGAFTGAHASRPGKFERADGGTLFLDEVGELPLSAQAKLLRVLQEGEVERLGDERTRKVSVRLVAATNVDLGRAVQEGRFRCDLFYRLNVYPIRIPPLRERVADIQPLVEAMVERFSALHVKRIRGVTDRAIQALMRYNWPGNIRELENMMERGVILAPQEGEISLEHLVVGPEVIGARREGISASGALEAHQGRGDACEGVCEAILDGGIALEELERNLLQLAVKRARGNLSGAARLLGLTRPQLNYRLKRDRD